MHRPDSSASQDLTALTRRTFLKTLMGGALFGWLASIVYPVVRYLLPPPDREAAVSSVKAGRVDEFPPNSGKIIKFGSKPALLVRKPNGDFAAFSAKCTHLDCNVQYRSDKQSIWCACHNGIYDLNGINVAGPPPRPLDALEIHVKGEEVFVSRKA